jgi:hypothetical protein
MKTTPRRRRRGRLDRTDVICDGRPGTTSGRHDTSDRIEMYFEAVTSPG